MMKFARLLNVGWFDVMCDQIVSAIVVNNILLFS